VIHDVKGVTDWSMMTIAKQIHCYTTDVNVATIEKSLRQGYRKLAHSKYAPMLAAAWGISVTVFERENHRACRTIADLRRIYGLDVNEIIERCDRLMAERDSQQQRLELYWGTVRQKLTKLGHHIDGIENEDRPPDLVEAERLRKTIRMLKAANRKERESG
jgi:hypothetical protein